MPSLLDIGPRSKHVPINGVQVEVRGLSGAAILFLLDSSEELRKLMGGGNRDIDPALLMSQAPGAVASAIALACGYHPQKNKAEPAQSREEFGKAVEMVSGLSLGDQVALCTTVFDMTFPQGVKSFTEALERLDGGVVGAPGKAPDTKSLGPSKV